MVISLKERKISGKIKQTLKNSYACPFCGKKFKIGLEYNILEVFKKDKLALYPHVHLHGNPLHGMVCYIDWQYNIRSIEVIKSIEISRDSETFGEIMSKWSNPY